MDFTRDMVMKSKKENLLSNKDKKQRFIGMLGQSLEHVGCETRHANGDKCPDCRDNRTICNVLRNYPVGDDTLYG